MTDDLPTSNHRHYSRTFLNRPGENGLAAVLAEIEAGDTDDNYVDFSAHLTLSDCNRTVMLDFGVYGSTRTEKDIVDLRSSSANGIHKALALKAEIDEFVKVLLKQQVEVHTAIAEAQKRVKKTKKSGKKGKKSA